MCNFDEMIVGNKLPSQTYYNTKYLRNVKTGDGRTVYSINILAHQTKTLAGMRIVPIMTQLEDFLHDYLNMLKDEDFLFLLNRGNLIRSSLFDYKWEKYYQR